MKLKNSKVLKVILFSLGLILTILGLWRFISPIGYYAGSGIILPDEVNILNTVRASGGAEIGFGVLVLMGCFLQKFSFTSTVVAAILYLSFGIGRVLSIGIDGCPGNMIIIFTVFEFILGSLGIWALYHYRDQ